MSEEDIGLQKNRFCLDQSLSKCRHLLSLIKRPHDITRGVSADGLNVVVEAENIHLTDIQNDEADLGHRNVVMKCGARG